MNQKQKRVTFNFLVKENSHIIKHSIHTKLEIVRRTSNSIQQHLKTKHPTEREDKYRESCVHQLTCPFSKNR